MHYFHTDASEVMGAAELFAADEWLERTEAIVAIAKTHRYTGFGTRTHLHLATDTHQTSWPIDESKMEIGSYIAFLKGLQTSHPPTNLYVHEQLHNWHV